MGLDGVTTAVLLPIMIRMVGTPYPEVS